MEEGNNTVIITVESVIKHWLKENGLRKKDLADKMGITYPTLQKYLSNPEIMTGEDRKKIAETLNVPVIEIDKICNGQFEDVNK